MSQIMQDLQSDYEKRPWLASYEEGMPATMEIEHATALDTFHSAVTEAPDRTAIHYFGRDVTFAELNQLAGSFAGFLVERGITKGDRVALYMQNVPQWVIALVGAWKAGLTVVCVNPMNKSAELAYILRDSGARVIVSDPDLYSVVRDVWVDTPSLELVVTADPWEMSNDHDSAPATFDGVVDFSEALTLGLTDPRIEAQPDDVGVLAYTSGTTGQPKGAMNTQANIAFASQAYRDWIHLDGSDRILGGAPLFHITGLIGHIGASFSARCPLILTNRFDMDSVHQLIVRYRPTFTIMTITAFGALIRLNAPKSDFESLDKVYSGGAAVAPAMRDRVKEHLGLTVHQAYGLTETTSPSHLQPFGSVSPVDPDSGALSVGVPIFDTMVRIVDEKGKDLPLGEVGEIEIAGPQVVPGYWQKPRESEEALPGGRLRTGDVGFMSPEGWFFVVDRKKDMINASGYKVWPREVEDVLYTHPAVNEVAVVGIPDEYRGETVKAIISLKPGATVTADEIVQYCRERLAAYKYPRQVVFLDDLPKTTTGKIMRRELRS